MFPGASILSLLLLGAPQEPPSNAPAPGGGDLIVHIIPELDNWELWDAGGGGGNHFTNCCEPYEDPMILRTWVVDYRVNGSGSVLHKTFRWMTPDPGDDYKKAAHRAAKA